jgi:hypothetical protein
MDIARGAEMLNVLFINMKFPMDAGRVWLKW